MMTDIKQKQEVENHYQLLESFSVWMSSCSIIIRTDFLKEDVRRLNDLF